MSDVGRGAPRVSVVVPSYNGVEHLPECLAALRSQTFTDFEVIVVDNGSTDDTPRWLDENASDMRVLRRDPNAGVGPALNDGIRAARGDYIALLNNDTAVDATWLAELVRALDETDYDFAAALMVFYDDPDTVNTAGDTYSLALLSGEQRGRLRPVAEFQSRARVLGASGGAAIYRRSFFDDVGLYDEDFFLLHEDTDLNLRALIAGKRCLFVPTAVVRHKDSATLRRDPPERLAALGLRNRYTVVAKDLPVVLIPLAGVVRVWLLFRDHIPLRPSGWRLIPGLLRTLPSHVRLESEGLRIGRGKRGDVWRRKRASTREIVRWLFDGVGQE